ncbi:MAG: CPBP family intramembrane metalloprotease [Methanophagales archaeon ANME-1-THS]|nr:MAG: CPBP family intramembrane metalloprotease [Methanophagales archaeon ANME-1-THS]
MRKRGQYRIGAAYVLVITAAELLMAYAIKAGIAVHVLIIFALLLHATRAVDKDRSLSQFLITLILAPLIRILSLSMPLTQFSRISWFMIISVPIFIAAFTCMALLELRPKDIGLSLPARRYAPVEATVILLALPFGIAEYLILKPAPLPELEQSITSLFAASLMFLVCTGFLEELIFRGVMQCSAVRWMGTCIGILFVSMIFGVLHVGNLALLDCLLAFAIGLIWSVVREKTGSIYGISISHGITNIILFILGPAYSTLLV